MWIHLSPDLRPLRLPDAFVEIYGASAAGRGVATRFTLPPPPEQDGERWPLRATDIDRLGHVNNAVYFQPLEERFGAVTHAELEYRKPIDLDDDVRVVVDGGDLWLTVRGEVRAPLSTTRGPDRATPLRP